MKSNVKRNSTVRRCSDTEPTKFTISVRESADDSYSLQAKGVSDENAILTLFIFCVEALQEQYNYKDKDLMKTLMVMLEDDFYDDDEEGD